MESRFELEVDQEIASLLPALDEGEYNELVESIKREGCRESIVVWRQVTGEGESKYIILDGHNRYRICQEHQISFKTVEHECGSKEDAVKWVIRNQIARRNLSKDQKRELIARYLKMAPDKSDRGIATDISVAHKTVGSVRRELEDGGEIPHRETVIGTDGIEQPRKHKQAPVFNQTNENVDWAKWTWNPFVGCKHGCEYCYARDMAARFYGDFELRFFDERLQAPSNTKIPEARLNEPGINNVFLGSMTDFFGDFIPEDWVSQVLEVVKQSPQWKYLILTKNPKRIKDYAPFPDNVWIGATVDVQARVEPTEAAFREFEARVKFVSCEPLLGPLQFSNLGLFDWVIVGGRSKNTKGPAMQPDIEWVCSLLLQAHKAGCKTYCKPNLTLIKDYPDD